MSESSNGRLAVCYQNFLESAFANITLRIQDLDKVNASLAEFFCFIPDDEPVVQPSSNLSLLP
jgi:hypothetical protein